MKVKTDLYLTYDRTKLVERSEPGATWLFVRAGGELSAADAKRYGVKAPRRRKPRSLVE